ncbi:MAG: amino acid adenylation domain-containing protein, partial [Sphaerospermopsis sp. SIO1G1]|nr:amino acid adenylation domain-containing protein [Sphaerospermopsis sp. SIO1G1]
NPNTQTKSENLAYVIYTSGSTGKPKGVEVKHKGVNRLVINTNYVKITAKDVIAQASNSAFDAATFEIWGALLTGAKLVGISKETALSPREFAQIIKDEGMSILFLTTALLNQIAQTEPTAFSTLRYLLFGGEAVDPKWVEEIVSKGKPENLLHVYGPTENTTFTTWYLVEEIAKDGTTIPIGKPIANSTIYVLDQNLQPVPVGVPGELHIGGAGLAKGYLKRPELTAKTFIANPLDNGKTKLYKTGDLVKYLEDGNIEYISRIDNQVKLRGFRIELGEIETVLNQNEDVQTSVVVIREDNPGYKQLVAYIVAETELSTSEIRQYLKGKIPEYMIPSGFVYLENLPLTPNGKVDKKALPAPNLTTEIADNYIAPQTPTEEILAAIWQQVLKVGSVGINDNFFELGGHSLLATQLVSRIRDQFQIEIPLQTVFVETTIAELAQAIEQLQKQNLQLAAPGILPRGENAELSLSYAQQRLWFIDQFEPNSASYNIPIALRLQGKLELTALENSFREIINRHEALRTNFQATEGKAGQIIHQTTNWQMSVIDLQNLSVLETERTVKELIQQQSIQPFDLVNDYLFRTTLVVLSETEHLLLICMHHIISDGWSMGVFVDELATLYNTYLQGQETTLKPLPIQYADFAIWQRNWLQGEVLERQLNYWQQQLETAPKFLPLPTDRSRPAVRTFAGSYQEFALSEELSNQLIQLSQEQGVTLFMTLFAAYNVLLYRYTGQTDILVGSPIANRNQKEIEGLIGFFVNTLVFRSELSENISFNELLTQIRTTSLSAYAHQDLPLEMLVEALEIERNLSHSPLFQVMFALQNAPTSDVELTGLTVKDVPIEITTAKFDLTLSMSQTATGIIGGWEYNTDLFDRKTIERMTGHFINLLSAIVEDSKAEISKLAILTAKEEQKILTEWNKTETEYPVDKCIHQIFAEQVAKTPDATAVVYGKEEITYTELNEKANQLAHYLHSLGVKANSLVGISVERSVEMIVGLLGILKAGGAYVPLDPEYPQERLTAIIEDAEIETILTTAKVAKNLPENQAKIICYEQELTTIEKQKITNPNTQTKSENLAYVIYTSGSTGKPKGVEVKHKGVNRLVINTNYVKITAKDVIAQASNSAFDAATFEIWGALLTGAKLVGISKETALSPREFAQIIKDEGMSILFLTTALLNQIAQTEPTAFSTLRYLLFGGEAVDPKWVEEIVSKGKPENLLHVYGPTENTTFTTWYLVEEIAKDGTTIPIGKPIANSTIYVLDQNLQPVPVGVPGELHIGGAGLAKGYLKRPELTAKTFIANPLDNGKTKLYKTGDLVKYLEDGNIEYISRIDNQVKLRGFRIELGEIETVLNQNEDVQTSVVVIREEHPGSKRLVAYIVSENPLETSEIRQYLKGKLPEYMIPSAFVYLEILPLTPNGKVDKRALPEPQINTEISDNYVAPKTEIETKLVEIWQQILGIEKIGINDNFFTLGGDSILSIQIIAKAKQAGIEITIKQLFANQTIAEIAAVAGKIGTLEIEQGTVTGNFPLTPIQKWYFKQNRPEPHHFNQAFLLTVPAEIEQEKLEQVWTEIINHHDSLRLNFTQTENQWEATHNEPIKRFKIEEFDISEIAETEQKQIIETTANRLQASLELKSNLVKVGLFKLGEKKPGRLLIVIHHLVVDGISWRILLEDLETGYKQITENQAIKLPRKTTSFKQWSEKLGEYATTEKLKTEIEYWVNTNNSEIKSLPVDKTGENTLASIENIAVSLNKKETKALLQQVPKAYKTQINDILLTALVLVLSKWTNSKSVLFNLEGHGREDILEGVDISRTIGWFTTMFPVVVNIEKEDLGNIIKSVKEQLREIPNKGIGYGVLRYLSDAEISNQLEKAQPAEISFNYLGQFTQTLNTSSLLSSADESSGEFQSLLGNRETVLDVNAIISEEQLQITWIYSHNIHEQKTIENIANDFINTLQEIINHCLEPENVGYTPSDFPLIKLNQQELDGIIDKLNLENIEDIYPLSPMQSGMLFESLYARNEGVYFEQITCTFNGELNVAAFTKAWQKLVNHHTIFRTAFIWESLSEPVQVVHKDVTIKVEVQDWRELSATEQETKIEQFLPNERKQGFQLNQTPLMRLYLLQLSDDSYQFVWNFHHILLDGWSLPLVWEDWFNYYHAIDTGVDSNIKPTINYSNYIAWLQEQQQQNLAQEFWQNKLSGFASPTPLVVEKPLSNRQQSEYQEQVAYLSVDHTKTATDFVRQHQLTMNNLVQGVWGILLSCYSQENDVVFGATVSGRPPSLTGVESMVGLFINTLPVRLQLEENSNALSVLQNLQQQQIDSEQFAYSPLVEIQGWSDVSRGTALFDSIVVFENYPIDSNNVETDAKLTIDNSRGIEHTNYPLTIISGPGEKLIIKISYDSSRFDEETIKRMLGHLITLITAIVTNPQVKINELPILTEKEKQTLLVTWNNTEIAYPEKTVTQLFREQVEKTPDAIAVVCENQRLTYDELNKKANQLANHLISLGIGTDTLVGIYIERSLEMIIGILGTLKAGGAYLPIDTEYPPERVNFMLDDAKINILLTQENLKQQIGNQQITKICLDTEWQIIDLNIQANLNVEITSNHLAYVIYTSGSTGTPKGVEIIHQGLTNLVNWHQKQFNITKADKATQLAGTGFDAAVWEIWPYITAGATLYLVRKEILTAPEQLQKWLTENHITVSFVPTPITQELLKLNWEKQTPLRYLLTGGDKLTQHPTEKIPFSVVNNYGPTENTVVTTSCILEAQKQQALPSIGKPIDNTKVYILDKHLKPVPIGVPGELCIGGLGIAKGYLNRPDLTAKTFIANPFDHGKTKLYKTGDLVRYLADGKIEYIGRSDNQVKIRGFRIELGEIETALSQNAEIQASCVIVREDKSGDKRLVAYIVSEAKLTTSELRQYLKDRLPGYMIPSAFVYLESLPLTANGKIDRRALPAPTVDTEIANNYVAPRTPTEEILTTIWQQVLKLETVGIHDNFFELGGHSLLATQLVSRIRDSLQIEISLQTVFAETTIAQLGKVIEQLQKQELQLAAPTILPRGENAEIPLSFAQQRLWFLDQLEPLSSSYNLPAALKLTGKLSIPTLDISLQEIINRHEALRTKFTAGAGTANQFIQQQTNWELSTIDLQHLPLEEAEVAGQKLLQQQAIQPFNIAEDFLIRATLVVLSETEHLLLICMHHIVSDGWSMGVFVAELVTVYNAYLQNQPSPLTPLPIQYADFAIWQRNWLQGEVLEQQLNYWKQQLETASKFLPLPTDRPRPAVQTFAGSYQEFALSQELSNQLIALSQKQGVTLFMTLFAAYNVLLYRYTGQTDILVGSPIANRNQREIEGLIGFFVNTLVFRTELSANPSFNELLTQIRSTALSAYAHQDLPFEMLVEALQPERDLSYTPLFQVMFILQNAPMSNVELTDVEVSALAIETTTAKFDLTLSMEQTATGIRGGWEYNTDLFDSSTIEKMTGNLTTLLSAIVASPQTRINQLPILTTTEQQTLVIDWNNTTTEYPQDKCIHQLFEEQVQKTPDAVAVVFTNQQLTYRELDDKANQLANYLCSQGVTTDVLVGISVERSLEMVIGLLGILKAGGAYLPLDPEYPTERLQFILEDAQVRFLLTQQHLVNHLPTNQAEIICLDSDCDVISQASEHHFQPQVQGNNLAYIIYTSGSTGKPKGVQIIHRAVVNFLTAMQEKPGITQSDILLGVTTISFDIAALEIFLPMTVGARLIIASRQVTMDGQQLAELLVNSQTTIMQATPATWRLLLENNCDLSNLKILCGGEALPGDIAEKLSTQGTSLWNLYGPTEATIWSSVYQIQPENDLISIGRPINNTQFYVLDQNLQPVPVGVPGELYIGGTGLAKGYLNRPELTSERFIPNPFDNGKTKLYQTGDLVRYLKDGNLEYISRIDNQVKLRGFRIELGEIETTLSQQENVQIACVIVREDTPGDQRLVAYIVPQPQQTPTSNILRQFLKAQLPDYMIPNTFVILESLPLTPNGKIDRRALSVPTPTNNADTFVAPRTDLELQLAQIWGDILKVENVGVRDNFFDLGGHSLLATYLMSQIRENLGQEIPLATLFQHPTVEELAIAITKIQQNTNSQTSPLVALQPRGSQPPFFCIPGAGGFPYYFYNLARALGENQPFYSFQAQGSDGELAPMTEVEEIAAYYIQAMQTVQPHGPYYLGGHSFGGKVAFAIAQQLIQQGEEVALVAILDTNAPVNYGRGEEADDTTWLISIANSLQTAFGKETEIDTETLRSLAPSQQLKYVLEYLQMLDILPPNANTQYIDNLLQAYKANNNIEYAPLQFTPIPITLFRASEMSPEEQAAFPSELLADDTWGWTPFASQPVDVQFVPGNHITMMTPPHVQTLATKLNTYIGDAEKVISDW